MASRAASLAELKKARASGKSRLSNYKVQEAARVYEEVDEAGYNDVLRRRLDEDDFVVNDNGAGYADDGREDWMHETRDESDSCTDGDLPAQSKTVKRKREEEEAAKAKQENHEINKYFMNRSAPIAKAKTAIATAAEDNFLNDLLDEVDVNISSRKPSRTVKTESRRKTRVLSPPVAPQRRTSLSPKPVELRQASPDGLQDKIVDGPSANHSHEGFADEWFPPSDPTPSSPTAERKTRMTAEVKDEYEDDEMLEIAQTTGDANLGAASINISGTRPTTRKVLQQEDKASIYPTPNDSSPTRPPTDSIDASTWNEVTSRLNVVSSQVSDQPVFSKLDAKNVLESDGSTNFFWIDYTEVNGSLCLFGKVKDRPTGQYVSAFVKVDNILRKLYFLPGRQSNGNDDERDNNEALHEVYKEADALLSHLGVTEHKMKACTRKYAFELPDIPKETQYLKALYPYDKPELRTLSGKAFSHVFGTSTALFEQFVLWKQIMGPCWLKIHHEAFTPINGASWCKFEAAINDPRKIGPLHESEALDAPPLTITSLAFRKTLNVAENKQEILAVSARVYENFSLSDTTPPERLPCKVYTIMRPAANIFPVGFDALCKKHRGEISLEKTENALLSRFLTILQKVDPDVLMGHQLQDVDYPVLLSRLRDKKISNWHRIGRLRRSEWPKSFGKGSSSFFSERQIISGRLLCDVANDMGKSLMTKCQSWSLTEMCDIYLGKEDSRRDIDNDDALKSWAQTRDGLFNYVNHCEADTYFIAAIAMRVQILPLSKVLTNLAGNSWARTLSGTRAERNEYILLHEFHKNKYICPDKSRNFAKPMAEPTIDGEDAGEIKKKDKFKGGLVFEPEKGLYDKFILVMDFNSLYPSIIQEYNICFTTVDRTQASNDEERIPELPTETQQGILPKLIATLVSRRRQVKGLMKDKKASAEQLATWDIKQLALKLTANSMYGCLGYVQSRFYARPLAMLTTFKGREILRSTKDLAESDQLRVIYGDTDSVMINTNVDKIEDALKIGYEFKRTVNERYKLLEIDIDNVFRRLLLHAKKKYAAINMVEVDGKYVDKLEVKGLDMKRREYCALSKEVSSTLLNQILSGEETEVVVQKVHEYLRELADRMRGEKVPVQKYIIFTKLGKDPKDYPNSDSMPQVQVALRSLSQGKIVRQNDVVAFITTAATDDTPSSDSAAKRAYAPAEVMSASSSLRPDIDWYLSKQIFPPIERLCAPMPGTDATHLAECLGLDTRKYNIGTFERNSASKEMTTLESQVPDAIRFANCSRLKLQCRWCRNTITFEGVRASIENIAASGITCRAASCGKTISTLAVIAQLESAIRKHTSRYYDGYLVCDDASCGNRTRQMSVYGRRCLGPNAHAFGCLGRMNYEYSEKDLYNQLLYYRSLFDVDDSKGKNNSSSSSLSNNEKDRNKAGENQAVPSGAGKDSDVEERINAMKEFNRERFNTCKSVVEAYLAKCGRVWVQMDTLFSFAFSKQ